MAGITFKEEVISYGTTEEILLNYADTLPVVDSLDWAQSFYLINSVLICKVYSCSVIIDQLFFSTPEDTPELVSSIENSKKIKIILSSPAIPNIGLTCDNEVFSLYIATNQEKIFKFTFQQGWGFSGYNYLKDSGGYLLDGIYPRCFSLLRVGENECDVCLGLNTGSICFVSLPETSSSDFVLPIKILEIGPPRSIMKTLTSFVKKRPYTDAVLKIHSMKTNQIVALSNGFVRLYNTSRPGLVCELDLGGEYEDYKFTAIAEHDNRSIAVGCKDRFQWYIYYIKVSVNSLDLSGKFIEQGELIDLGINLQGIWSVTKHENRCKISIKPFVGDNSYVSSWEDVIDLKEIEDECINDMYIDSPDLIIERILNPGRFSKKSLKIAIQKVLGIELDINTFENTDILKKLTSDQISMILLSLKTYQSKEYQISGICCCEEIGDFPVIVIRGYDNVGFIRHAINIESSSLFINKTALEFYPLCRSYLPRYVNKFKISCFKTGIERCLCVIRLWRLKYSFLLHDFAETSFVEILKTISTQSMPDHILKLLLRSLPVDLDQAAAQEVHTMSCTLSTISETTLTPSQVYWPKFIISLIGNSIKSLAESILDYSLDLSILLILSETTLKKFVFSKVQDASIQNSISITSCLYSICKSLCIPLNNLYKKDPGLCLQLEGYSFPVGITQIYVLNRSDVLFGDKHSFCLGELNTWISNVINASVHEIFVICDNDKYYTSCILKVLSEYGEAGIIHRYMSLSNVTNSAVLFLLGSAYAKEGSNDLALNQFYRGGAMIETGNFETNYQNFIQGPWGININTENVDILNTYNVAVASHLPTFNSKKIILGDFIISSVYGVFDEKILRVVQHLANISAYNEAITLLLAHSNKKIIKQGIEIILENALEKNEFFMFLELPLNSCMKEMVLKKLQTKSIQDHFDLVKTISSKKYYEKAALFFISLFTLEDRVSYKSDRLPWHLGLYTFAMSNQYYSSAAEGIYRYANEVYEFSIRLQENKHESLDDINFIREIFKENLLLAILAARNINHNYEDCWFLVHIAETRSKRKISSSSRDENTVIRHIVTLKELEEKITSFLIN